MMETPAAIDGEDTTTPQASQPKSASSARAIHRRIQRAHAKNIRYALHLDTLQVYVQERLIPMGLDLKRKCQPTIGSQNTDFVRRWVDILDAASQNLMDMVIEYSAQMVAESDDEIVRLTETLQAVTLESEFEQFQETLEKYNSKLRKKIEEQKKKKLERDRLMAKEKSITVYKEHRLSISSSSSGSNSSIDQMDVFAPVMGAIHQQQQHYQQQQQQTEHATMNMNMVRHKSPTPEFIVPPAIAERTRLRPASAPEFVPPPSPQLPEKSTRHSVHFELPSPDLNARRQEYNPPQRGSGNPGLRPPPSPRNPRKQIGSGRIVEPKSPRPRRSNRPSRSADTQHRTESQDGAPVTPNTPRKHRQDSTSRNSQPPRPNTTPRQRRRDFNPKKT